MIEHGRRIGIGGRERGLWDTEEKRRMSRRRATEVMDGNGGKDCNQYLDVGPGIYRKEWVCIHFDTRVEM
jgi:hypothetical protein